MNALAVAAVIRLGAKAGHANAGDDPLIGLLVVVEWISRLRGPPRLVINGRIPAYRPHRFSADIRDAYPASFARG